MKEKNKMVIYMVYSTRRMALMSQIQLGRFLGVKGQTVSRWEAGICTPPADKYQAILDLRKKLTRASRRRGPYAGEVAL